MTRRPLGRTGFQATVLGIGDLADRTVPIATCVATLRRALDFGLSVADCLHYTLTLDPDVTLLGMSFPNEQDAVLQAFRSFRALTTEQMDEIRRRAEMAVEGKGECWWNPEAT